MGNFLALVVSAVAASVAPLQTFIFVVCSLSSIVGKLSVFQMRYDLVTADDVRGGDFLPATICAFVAAPHARGARLC